jgi:hypothetical protein
VYFANDRTKYSGNQDDAPQGAQGHYQTQTSQPSNRQQTISTGPSGTVQNGLNAKSRVMNLKTEMRWDWNALGEFASEVLGRKVSKVITDIKTEEEWKKVEDALLITKQAS